MKKIEEQALLWYKHEEGVTAEESNIEIGISGMNVFPPSEFQKANQMVALVHVLTPICDVRVSVHESKAYPGVLYLRVPQSALPVGEEVVFNDEVKFHRKAKAQILKHVDSLLIKEEECTNKEHTHIVKSVDPATEAEMATIGQGATMYCHQCACQWSTTL